MTEPKYTELQIKHTELLARMDSKMDKILDLLQKQDDRLTAVEIWRDEQEKQQVRVKAWIAGAVAVFTAAVEGLRWLLH